MSRAFLFIPMLMAAAACSDSPTSPAARRLVTESEDSDLQTVTGTVVASNVLRRLEDGVEIPLIGPQTAMLNDLVGAEIRILGTADEGGPAALWIIEFRVLRVDDLPALDGRLAESEGGFGIETDEGDVIRITELPDELKYHVGDRVWLTTHEGRWVRFGVLEM